MSTLIELHDLQKTYWLGDMALDVLKGISLAIEEGDLVSLMGVSGSGKSTLMNILGFLDVPTSGRYILRGDDVSRLSRDARADIRNEHIGFVFQSFNLLARTSALQNVMLPMEYTHGVSRKQAKERAEMLLENVGLKDRMNHHPAQLSGGQQQRVAIARALINKPSILFADEPTGNLDSKTGVEILHMFQQLNAQEGLTVVLVTHDAEVSAYARRVIHMRDGVISEGGLS